MADKKISELPVLPSASIVPATDVLPVVNDGITKQVTISDAVLSAIGGLTSGVTTVNGRAGIVTLTSTDVGLANVDNTSDANKPISSAQQTALNAKQATLVSGTNIKTVGGTTLLGSGDIPFSGAVSGATTSTGSIVLTSSSTGVQRVSFTARGQYIKQADATTLNKGIINVLHNSSEYVGRILDSAGTLIGILAPNDVATCSLSDNSTAAGVWDISGARIGGATAQLGVTGTVIGGSNYFQAIPLDATRTLLLYGNSGVYGVVYDKSTQTWGTPTLIRASVTANSVGILTSTDRVLVCSAITTAMQSVVLSISGTSISLNTPTATTITTTANFADLIAVGTSWVVVNLNGEIRAITISGTLPSVGSAQTVSVAITANLYASGSVVLLIGCINGSNGVAAPFTVSGNTLTPGTAATFGNTITTLKTVVFGTRWLAYYNDSTFGNPCAALISLSGTTVTKTQADSYIAAGLNLTQEGIVCNGKFVVAATPSSGASQVFFNVLTDTAGTLSAGTFVTLNVTGLTSNVAPTGIGVSGSVATFVNNIQTYQVDASGASPVVSVLPGNKILDQTQLPSPSFSKSGNGPANAVYSGTTAVLVPSGGSQAVVCGLTICRTVLLGAPTVVTGQHSRGNTTSELWTLQVSSAEPRYAIQLFEAVQ